MPSTRSLASLAFLSLVACGGTVVFEEDGGQGGEGEDTTGRAAATSAQSGPGSSTSSGAGGSGGGSVSSVSSTGNGGGAVVASVGVSTVDAVSVGPTTTIGSGGSGGGDCASNTIYTDCLAHGECVPIFDDLCCSSCFPGECADCVMHQFVGCTERLPPEPGGTCGSPPCGFIPDWACEGVNPECGDDCFGQPGCFEHIRCGDIDCTFECGPAFPDSCGPVECDAPPPPCFDGTVPEASSGCWTGACIPAWVCSVQPPL